MSENEKYCYSKIDEEPKGNSAIRDRGSSFGRRDPLDEFLSSFPIQPVQEDQPAKKPEPDKAELEKKKKIEKINRLYQELYEYDKKFERAKGIRFTVTLLVFAVGYFALLSIVSGITDIKEIFDMNIGAILIQALISIIFAWLHFLANYAIFGQLSEMGSRETKTLDNIRRAIAEAKKEIDD